MNLMWSAFLRYAAQQANGGSIRQFKGLEAAWVHSALVVNNATYLVEPVANETELRSRFAAAAEEAAPHQLPWAFFLYEPYASSLNPEQVTAAAAASGLARTLGVQVMTADAGALMPPKGPLPVPEFRRINGRDDSRIALDINMRSYSMPGFMTDSIVNANAYYQDPQREFGFIAYAGGMPVSTATVIELDDWLYVALVATEPEQRKKGYAEAVMRHALIAASAELGISRTTLDASVMGAPLYLQMGYRHTGESWSMYVSGH